MSIVNNSHRNSNLLMSKPKIERRNRMPNGHIFRGKERLVKQVTPVHLRRTRADFEVEEQNMFYLRFPYLTETQSKGHAKALGKDIQYKQKWQDQTRSEFKPDVKLQDRLLHLRVTEGWE